MAWGYIRFRQDGQGAWLHDAHSVYGSSDPAFTPAACPFEDSLSEDNDDRVYLVPQAVAKAFSDRYIAACRRGAEGGGPPYVRLLEHGVTFDGELCLVMRGGFPVAYLDTLGEDDVLEGELVAPAALPPASPPPRELVGEAGPEAVVPLERLPRPPAEGA